MYPERQSLVCCRVSVLLFDPHLQELGLQLHLGNVALQIKDNEYSILANAWKQLSVLPSARSLYLKAKSQATQYNKLQCENHLQKLTVQSKFSSSAELERSCKTWNRLLAGFHPGQLSFLLRAASDTLPTAVNLRRWSIQCDAKCLLCDCTRPTTAHVLNGCPVALTQQRYTYRHYQVLSILATMLTKIFADSPSIQVFADLNNHQACEAPQATVLTQILITSYRPDIVIYNSQVYSIALLELTCPLDSYQHLESSWNRKQAKVEYLQLLAESISNYVNFIQFSNPSMTIAKSTVRKCLDDAAFQSILASERIFLARDNKEWLDLSSTN